MLHPITTNRPTGKLLFAFPDSGNLANYANGLGNRVAVLESPSPNLGRYTASLDDSVDTLWRLFEGITQPGSWAESIEYFDLASGTATLIVTPSVGLGDYDVTTRELVLPFDAQYTIVRVVVDSAGDQVTLPANCTFELTNANELHLATLVPAINGAAYTVVIPRNLTNQIRTINFALRDPTTNLALDHGTIQFTYAATEPS
jgi:hypothetical protein